MIPDWLIQILFNALISGCFSGLIVAVVKARMEHYYQKKHEEEKRAEAQKEKQERLEKENLEKDLNLIRAEVLAVKGKVSQVSDKLTFVKESVAVIIAKQESQDHRISEVSDMVKNIVSQNFGKVRRIT
jgi:hypothetical protein